MSGRLRSERGYTLVELLIVMPVLTLVLAGLGWALIDVVHTSAKAQEEATLQAQARAAVAAIADDVRSAFVGDGSSPILVATPTALTVLSPDRYPTVASGSTETSFHLRQVAYSVSGGVLERQVLTSTNTYPTAPPWTWSGSPGPWESLAGSVVNTDVFTYYNGTGAQASPPTPLPFPVSASSAGIRAVGIKLVLATSGPQGATFTVTDTVTLRSAG